MLLKTPKCRLDVSAGPAPRFLILADSLNFRARGGVGAEIELLVFGMTTCEGARGSGDLNRARKELPLWK